MERASDGRVLVIADASVLINFLRVGRLDLLRHHGGYKLIVTEHVRREVAYPDQAAELTMALSAGDIDEIQLTDPVELSLFAELNAVLGRGESASIAVAANRGWVIAMDELGRAQREVYARVGRNRLINTPGLILSCIRNGAITVPRRTASRIISSPRVSRSPLASTASATCSRLRVRARAQAPRLPTFASVDPQILQTDPCPL